MHECIYKDFYSKSSARQYGRAVGQILSTALDSRTSLFESVLITRILFKFEN